MTIRDFLAVGATALLAAGCGAPAPAPTPSSPAWPSMRFEAALNPADRSPETWLRLPFPSDERRRPDGTLVVDDFPVGTSVVRTWRDEAAKLVGFGLQSPIFFAFTGAIPTDGLPASPSESLAKTATIQLIDVGSGPSGGRRYPIRWRFSGVPGDSLYLAHNTLAIAPAEGFLLAEGRPHAALVLGPAGSTSPALARALGEESPDGPEAVARWQVFEPLRRFLAVEGIDPARVVAATVFTTGTPSAELRTLAADALRRTSPAGASIAFKPARSGAPIVAQDTFRWDADAEVTYRLVGGEVSLANYQDGEVPYGTEGGAFVDPARAAPKADRTNVVLTVPAGAPRGATCLPLVIYGHGTGGTAMSGVTDGTAPRLAARGLAMLSFDQPLHGLRALGKTFDVDALTFNVANPASFRTTMRQGALDLIQVDALTRALPPLPEGFSPLPLCSGAPAQFGHSQGGLSLAMALGVGLVPPRTVLSGTGGALRVTIAERKDPVDFAALVRLGARIAAEEVLDDRHPIMGLLQLLGDVSDPATYAAHWPTSPLMQTAGVLDAATPFRSASSLAVASRQRLVGEPAWTFDSFELRGATASLAPVADRSFLEFGPGTTNADASHFVIFKRPEAVDASMAFLVDGTVRRNPSATTR